eukprot:COSAG02_NODE_30_length_50867_cov_66.594331_13_plen_94_part_00
MQLTRWVGPSSPVNSSIHNLIPDSHRNLLLVISVVATGGPAATPGVSRQYSTGTSPAGRGGAAVVLRCGGGRHSAVGGLLQQERCGEGAARWA